MVQNINISSREHNSTNEVAMLITLAKDTGWKMQALKEVKRLKGKIIVGAYVIRQNSGATKYSENSIKKLLANAAIDNCYLTLKKSGTEISKTIPLASLAVDPTVHGPGVYKQFIIPEGIDQEECFIWFRSDNLTDATEDLVIHWVFIDENVCGKVNLC